MQNVLDTCQIVNDRASSALFTSTKDSTLKNNEKLFNHLLQ